MAAQPFQELKPKPVESFLTPLPLTAPTKTTNKSCCLSLPSGISPFLPTSYGSTGIQAAITCPQRYHRDFPSGVSLAPSVFSQHSSERDLPLHGSLTGACRTASQAARELLSHLTSLTSAPTTLPLTPPAPASLSQLQYSLPCPLRPTAVTLLLTPTLDPSPVPPAPAALNTSSIPCDSLT